MRPLLFLLAAITVIALIVAPAQAGTAQAAPAVQECEQPAVLMVRPCPILRPRLWVPAVPVETAAVVLVPRRVLIPTCKVTTLSTDCGTCKAVIRRGVIVRRRVLLVQ